MKFTTIAATTLTVFAASSVNAQSSAASPGTAAQAQGTYARACMPWPLLSVLLTFSFLPSHLACITACTSVSTTAECELCSHFHWPAVLSFLTLSDYLFAVLGKIACPESAYTNMTALVGCICPTAATLQSLDTCYSCLPALGSAITAAQTAQVNQLYQAYVTLLFLLHYTEYKHRL